MNSAAEKTYKKQINKPKPEWVPDDEWQYANMSYTQLVQDFYEYKSTSTYYEIWFNAIEAFVTSECLKGFWLKVSNSKNTGFVHSLYSIFFSYSVSKPNISLSERDETITEIQKKLKDISTLLNSDTSVSAFFDYAYVKTIANFFDLKSFNGSSNDFIKSLHTALRVRPEYSDDVQLITIRESFL